MKKRVTLIASLLIVVSLISIISIGSLAYFTASSTATNVITTGDIDISLEEKMLLEDGSLVAYPADEAVAVMPGETLSKIPCIENIGNQDAYIRVKINTTITAEDGKSLSAEGVSYNIDPAYWVMDEEGFYRYVGKLSADKVVAPFSEVAFDKAMDEAYKNSEIVIDVTAYAVQVANNEPSDILDVQGFPEVGGAD